MSIREFVTPQILQKMKDSFDDFDDDNDGEIETQMLERAIRSFGLNPSNDEISDVLSDVSNSNTVNFNTYAYIIYHMARSRDTEKELISAFQLFDKDGTGKIPLSLVRDILTKIKRPFTESQLETILKSLHNDNGYIDYSELASLMTKN